MEISTETLALHDCSDRPAKNDLRRNADILVVLKEENEESCKSASSVSCERSLTHCGVFRDKWLAWRLVG